MDTASKRRFNTLLSVPRGTVDGLHGRQHRTAPHLVALCVRLLNTRYPESTPLWYSKIMPRYNDSTRELFLLHARHVHDSRKQNDINHAACV